MVDKKDNFGEGKEGSNSLEESHKKIKERNKGKDISDTEETLENEENKEKDRAIHETEGEIDQIKKEIYLKNEAIEKEKRKKESETSDQKIRREIQQGNFKNLDKLTDIDDYILDLLIQNHPKTQVLEHGENLRIAVKHSFKEGDKIASDVFGTAIKERDKKYSNFEKGKLNLSGLNKLTPHQAERISWIQNILEIHLNGLKEFSVEVAENLKWTDTHTLYLTGIFLKNLDSKIKNILQEKNPEIRIVLQDGEIPPKNEEEWS